MCVCLCASVVELFVCSLIKQPVIMSSTCETSSIMCTNHISVILIFIVLQEERNHHLVSQCCVCRVLYNIVLM